MSDEMTFKVLFHQGDELGLATRGRTGRLALTAEAVCIMGREACVISCGSLRGVELFRMHKIGSVIKVTHANGTLFVTVVRFSLFGLLALVNRTATRQLAEELGRRIPGPLPEPGASFLAHLAEVPWFSNIGRRDATTDVEWLASWDAWPGPEDGSVALLHERQQALQDEILAAAGEGWLELRRLWDAVHDAAFRQARLRLPDSNEDPWHGPSTAVRQAAFTAGLIALCLQTSRPVPPDLQRQWAWFQKGHWPSGYVSGLEGVEFERLMVY